MDIYINAAMTKGIIDSGYGSMVKERLEQGWDGYLISLMFNRVRGSRLNVIRQMEREVERVYATVLTRIIRDPRKVPILALPLWVVCPDYPIPKHAKQDLRYVTVNDGLHMHGIALIPPWNRMNEQFERHFEMYQELYVRQGYPLHRVHAVPITTDPGYVTAYALKAVQRRRLDFDNVLILPRTHSEMTTAGPPGANQSALST